MRLIIIRRSFLLPILGFLGFALMFYFTWDGNSLDELISFEGGLVYSSSIDILFAIGTLVFGFYLILVIFGNLVFRKSINFNVQGVREELSRNHLGLIPWSKIERIHIHKSLIAGGIRIALTEEFVDCLGQNIKPPVFLHENTIRNERDLMVTELSISTKQEDAVLKLCRKQNTPVVKMSR